MKLECNHYFSFIVASDFLSCMVTDSGTACACECLSVYVSVFVQFNMHRCLEEDLCVSICVYIVGLKIQRFIGSSRTELGET